MNYLIPRATLSGVMLGKITDTGRILKGNDQFALVIDQVIRGIGTSPANNLRCIPDSPKVKKKDIKSLRQLIGKPERRGPGKPENLKPIQEADRYKGKINWEDERDFIKSQISDGISLMSIAKNLGVTPSAMSKANKKYGLYSPRQRVGNSVNQGGIEYA